MKNRDPELKPLALDAVDAWGWPWHQQIKQTLGAAEGELILADSTPVPVNQVAGYQNTLLWDIDATPPETSDEIDSLGGEWWGQAVVRFTQGDWRYGGGLALNGLPLWIPSETAPPSLPFFVLADVYADFGVDHALHWVYMEEGVAVDVVTPLSLEQLGQGEGSPGCIVFSGNTSSMAPPSEYRSVVLDTWRNKVLIGITGAGFLGPFVSRPGGTSPPNDGAPPDAWSQQYLALAEVVATSKSEVTWTLLESRTTALGDPIAEESDEGEPNDRTFSSELTITSALLNAWYKPDGTVQTSRYHRHDLSTYRYAPDPFVPGLMILASEIATTLTLLDLSGSDLDELKLTKRVDRVSGNGQFDYTSTITRGDEEPSVSNYNAPGADAPVEEPFQPIKLGDLQMLINMLGQQVIIGGTQMLPPQGYRQCWLARGSNKAASICFSFEDSPYDLGEETLLEIDSGPCVTPSGVHTERTARTITFPAPSLPELRRYGFFVPPAYLFTLASYNPVTNALARNDHENYSTWA